MCSAWSSLSQLELNHVLLHTSPSVLEAIAALPRLQSASLTFSEPPDGSWHLLRQLGSRLASLRFDFLAPLADLEAPAFNFGGDFDEEDSEEDAELEPPAPPPLEWPAQLLALPECGEVKLFLNAEELSYQGFCWPANALEGIERLPTLREVSAVCDVPQQVWVCGQLTNLFLQKMRSCVPDVPPSLSSLQRLELVWCTVGQFPAALCSLPALTSLQISECKLHRTPALPLEMSKLRWVWVAADAWARTDGPVELNSLPLMAVLRAGACGSW